LVGIKAFFFFLKIKNPIGLPSYGFFLCVESRFGKTLKTKNEARVKRSEEVYVQGMAMNAVSHK